jgi:hypothetical protein
VLKFALKNTILWCEPQCSKTGIFYGFIIRQVFSSTSESSVLKCSLIVIEVNLQITCFDIIRHALSFQVSVIITFV